MKITMLFVSSLLALVASLSFSDVAFAGAPACTGHAAVPSDANCFFSNNCAMQNQCAGLKYWEVSDFITTGGNHTVQVVGFRPNGGTFTCIACSTTKEGSASCTPWVPLTTVGIHTQFTLGTVNVPSFGGLFVSCYMSQSAWFDSANW